MRSVLLRNFALFRLRSSFNMEAPISFEKLTKSLRQASVSTCSQHVSNRFASVLIPLFQDKEGTVQVVLTERSSKLATHSGEVCLPGGKREPGDADDVATALREAHEELGINPASVEILARLPCVLSKHLLSVAPVVGIIPPNTKFRPDASEVAAVFTAPLRMFIEGGPGYYSRDVEWEKGIAYRLHFFPHAHQGREYLIWGLTAGILISVAEHACGRKAAFQVNPPGARPYTDLLWDGYRLQYRTVEPAPAQASGGTVRRMIRAAAAAEATAAAEAGREQVAVVALHAGSGAQSIVFGEVEEQQQQGTEGVVSRGACHVGERGENQGQGPGGDLAAAL